MFGAELERTVEASGLTPTERATFTQRLEAARAAIDDYVAWLENLEARLASGATAVRVIRDLMLETK